MTEVATGKPGQLRGGYAMEGGSVAQNPAVRASRHRNSAERIGDAEQILEGARHGTPSGAAREHKRAVDVEENESGHGRNRILRCDSDRRATRSSGRFAAHVAGAWP